MSNSWWYLELFAEEFYHVLPPKNSPVVMDDHDISYRAAMVPWRFPMFLSGSVSKSGHDAWQFYDHPSCVHSHGDVFLFDHLKDVFLSSFQVSL